MVTFVKTGNSIELTFSSGEVYYLLPDNLLYTRPQEGKIYIKNDVASIGYFRFEPTEINGRPSDDLEDVALWLRDDFFTGITLQATGDIDLGDVTIINGTGANAVNIRDGGNSITVDAPLATPVNVQIGDGTATADVVPLAGSDALAVAIVDGSGDQITSFGGGTQYTEGNTDSSITGTALMWEDTSDTLRPVSEAKPLPVNIMSNQADEFGFQTTSNLNNGATYDSGVLGLSPEFSQVQTHVRASANGTINIYWYSDSGGVDTIRTLTIPYNSSDGFQMFSAPAFSPYVKYTFTNTGTAQTDFYFDTKFLTKPVSGQILTLNGPISTAMVANLGRNIIVGESSAGGGSFVNVKVNPSGTLETNSNLAAGTNYIGKVRLTDGTTDAEVVPLTGYNAQAVAIVDGSGNQITTFGGGTQYTEGDTDASITGTAMLMESAANTLVPVQGTVADGMLVNLGANNDVSVSNTVTVQATALDIRDLTSASDSVAAAQSGTWNINNVSGTISLPTGASTESTLSTLNGKIPANLTVTSTRLLVDGSGVTQPVSGTVTANLASGTNNIGDVDVLSLPSIPAGTNNIGDVDILSIAAGDNNIGNVDIVTMPNVVIGSGTVTTVSTVTSLTQMNGQAIAMGTGARSAGTQRVTIATDDVVPASQSGTWTVQPGNTANTTPWLVRETSSTPAQTSPSVTNSSTSILASNSNRRGATIYNEGSAICYMKLGSTASTTSYSCQIASGGYYELPFGYTGAIDGITSSGTAQLRVTELT